MAWVPAAIATAVLAASCLARDTSGSPRVVIPEPQDSGSPVTAMDAAADQTAAMALTPQVPLDTNEKLLTVHQDNLNLEPTDEQILITQVTSDPTAPIRVSVVEYDPVAEVYRRSWEGDTQARDERYVRVETRDVVGDHSPAIVVHGATPEGLPTMDVFRRAAGAGTLLSYTPIFSAVSKGDIEIQVEPRSQAYLAGDTDGAPFAVVVTEPAGDGTDIVKTTHQWSTRDRRYVPTTPVRIQGETVEREKLAALFSSGSPAVYLDFLRGTWIRSEDGSDTGLLLFWPETKTLQIYSATDSIQEEYHWERADAYYRNVNIRGASNAILRDINKDVLISIESLEEIKVTLVTTIDGLDRWTATYRRADDQIVAPGATDPEARKLEQPHGLYRSAGGDEIAFTPPRFTWIGPAQTLSGGFYLYSVGRTDRPVLGLLIQKGYGARSEERAYVAEHSTLVEPDRVVKTLVLQPAELTVYGARPISDDRLTFVQVQTLTQPLAGS